MESNGELAESSDSVGNSDLRVDRSCVIIGLLSSNINQYFFSYLFKFKLGYEMVFICYEWIYGHGNSEVLHILVDSTTRVYYVYTATGIVYRLTGNLKTTVFRKSKLYIGTSVNTYMYSTVQLTPPHPAHDASYFLLLCIFIYDWYLSCTSIHTTQPQLGEQVCLLSSYIWALTTSTTNKNAWIY